jgi:hypothetical protein
MGIHRQIGFFAIAFFGGIVILSGLFLSRVFAKH